MTESAERFEIYGNVIEIPRSKSETNAVRRVFVQIASDWENRIINGFHEIFSSLEDLCNRGDSLADQVRTQSINEAMKLLVAYGIYETSEQQFYEDFMGPYDSWDEDFSAVTEQFEAIVENSANLDAYRTARRQNRKQLGETDSWNLTTNIAHGVFNLMAKGVSAIGDSIKKDEIFKSEATVQQIATAAGSIAKAAFLGTVDAINSESSEALHDYSSEEIKKASAIIENIEKGRIPEAALLSSLIKAISIYPYNEDIYSHLLRNYGGDQGRLDRMVEYFGVRDFPAEKEALIEAKIDQLDISSLEEIKASQPDLENYAEYLCYEGFSSRYQQLICDLEKKESAKEGEAFPSDAPDCVVNKNDGELSLEIAVQGFKSNADHKFYVAPDLPLKKISNFLAKNNLKSNEEEIVFFFDDTVFGSGDAGVLVSLKSIEVRLPFGEEHCVSLSDIQSVDISGVLNKKISIKQQDGKKIGFTLTQSNNGAKTLCEAIGGLAKLSKSLVTA